jgi:hypothetical protein
MSPSGEGAGMEPIYPVEVGFVAVSQYVGELQVQKVAEQIATHIRTWLQQKGLEARLSVKPEAGVRVQLRGGGEMEAGVRSPMPVCC